VCGVIVNLSPLPILVMKDWKNTRNTKWLWSGGSTGWGRDYDGLKVFRWSIVWGRWIAPWVWIRIPNTPRWAPTIVW
jgi:hypothetical protein